MCFASAILGLLFAMGLTTWYDQTQAQAQPVSESYHPSVNLPDLAEPRDNDQDPVPQARTFTPDEMTGISVYEKVDRGVVNIRTVGEVFDIFSIQQSEGGGSGWVYDREGHIVTNHHVIADSDLIEVTLFDGRTAEAKVVGTDPANDIAVLKIDVPAEVLFPVEVGESSTLRVGQKVYAIGNPLGLERTMTEGIISSLNRTLRADTRIPRLINSIIQIDAALNRGNSGGPLLDTSGKLIGMNTAIASSTGEDNGIGFAISANNIRRVVPLLIRDGRVVRPSLGIAAVLPTRTGVVVVELVDKGPAQRAGLRAAYWTELVRVPGGTLARTRLNQRRADQILAVDGRPVRSAEELLNEVEKHRLGDTVTLRILRDGKQMDLPLKLDEEE